jgi:hypothetical protein
MTPGPAVERVRTAARKLGQHPQDHGWRELYRLFAYGLDRDDQAPRLVAAVIRASGRRTGNSAVHLVTLLGIAVRTLAGSRFGELVGDRPAADRLAALEELLARYPREVDQVLALRRNSFTGARRFLVPQVLLAAYFARWEHPVRFADFGTGLGVLPRQLNSRTLFDRFAGDLTWPGGRPVFQPLRLAARFGVDRAPLPDLAWVRSCYGPSAYYAAQYLELTEILDLPEVRTAEVEYVELDLTDHTALRRFVQERRVNVANLCYTLYEIEPTERAGILDTLAEALSDPGLMIVTEPNDDLTRPGCTVTVRDRAGPARLPVCAVSDGHFRGQVTPLAGYREFVDNYPIRFDTRPTGCGQPTGAVDAASRDHAAG